MALNMKRFFGKEEEQTDEYVEIDLDAIEPKDEKVIVKPYVLRHYDDVTNILNSLRDGYTIAVVDIKPLKSKDIIELKRSISKIKKTVEALNGSIAGFGEHTIIATPNFAKIQKDTPQPDQSKSKMDFIHD